MTEVWIRVTSLLIIGPLVWKQMTPFGGLSQATGRFGLHLRIHYYPTTSLRGPCNHGDWPSGAFHAKIEAENTGFP